MKWNRGTALLARPRLRPRPVARRRAIASHLPGKRRLLLAAVLLAVAFYPLSGPAPGQQELPGCSGCHQQPASAERWAAPLSGTWTAGGGNSAAAGTAPAGGQAYVAVGGALAVVGTGSTVSAYGLSDGALKWLITLPARFGATIISVRAWPGVITVGLLGRGATRTEVVLDAATGARLRHYPAAVFGGAVAASPTAAVIVGRSTVTSYDNKTGRIRWRRRVPAGQPWRVDGETLYVAQSKGGYLAAGPVTALREINTDTGTERVLDSPLGHPFSGTLAIAASGILIFTSATAVTAYSAATGGELWSLPSAVPEGADPATGLLYLTSASGALTAVDPLTGSVRASVSGSTAGGAAGMYVVRGGVALGLDSGAGGEAWGYNVAAGRVTWTAPGLPWPHYFADVSGLGGSAALAGNLVVITACPHLTATPAPSASSTPAASVPTLGSTASAIPVSPSASASPAPAPPAPAQVCADPELVALRV